MSLADHYDNQNYLPEGWHQVTVIEHAVEKPAKANHPKVEFKVQHADGRGARSQAFWLTDKALGFLASFAAACGVSKDDMRNYDPHNPNAHAQLHRKELYVLVVKEGKYHHFEEWRALADGPPPESFRRPPEQEQPAGRVEPAQDTPF